MQANTTDFIAKLAWQHTKTQWKAFILSPILGLIAFSLLAALWVWLSQWIGVVGGILGFVTGIANFVFMVSYSVALAKWCEDLHKGTKTLDIQAGYRYGLSRFWGTLGTGIIVMIKTFLWFLLLILPGYYKMVQYKHAMSITRLEKISGNKATQLSQKLVMEAGWLRTFGNLLSWNTITAIGLYIVGALALLIGAALAWIHPILGGVVGGALISFIFIAFIALLANFNTFEFLVYRDENSKAFNEAKAALGKL